MAAKNNNQVNLVDLFFYLLRNWYWFAICVAICVGIAYYRYAKKPLVYRSDATVIIKDPSNTQSTVQMNTYSSLINRVSMSNEILQLQSKELMTEVVRTLDADVDYKVHVKLRDLEYYKLSPVRMTFSRAPGVSETFALKVIPLDEKSVRLVLDDGNEQVAALGDTLSILGNQLCFRPNPEYGPGTFAKYPFPLWRKWSSPFVHSVWLRRQ